MAKTKSKKYYVCAECGSEATKWQGQCLDCNSWNSYKEFFVKPDNHTSDFNTGFSGQISTVQDLGSIDTETTPRFTSSIQEFDRVLGGGFVPGSSILMGGSPGAGKSTLLLQILCKLATTRKALYVSGEESLQQIASRAKRLKLQAPKLALVAETCVNRIIEIAQQIQPEVIVIDSIQVMYKEGVDCIPGNTVQVRESAAYLTRFAKQTKTTILLVGHVTKDNSLAGPMTLSHIVDTQIMLNSAEDERYRVLRVSKNRFGQINELGVFAMTASGLKEVKNPSAIFLSRSSNPTPGSVVSIIWEGTRAILLEVQGLVVDSNLGNPRRVTLGIDHNRLSMLVAILNRHGGIMIADQDIFLNVVGGVKVSETSTDLASILALISSLRNKPLHNKLVVFGEVGLSGEIRPITNGNERLQEAMKHGFTTAIIPKLNTPTEPIGNLKIIAVDKLTDAIARLNEVEIC
jgi:DNA repair protein RadA/Sms